MLVFNPELLFTNCRITLILGVMFVVNLCKNIYRWVVTVTVGHKTTVTEVTECKQRNPMNETETEMNGMDESVCKEGGVSMMNTTSMNIDSSTGSSDSGKHSSVSGRLTRHGVTSMNWDVESIID